MKISRIGYSGRTVVVLGAGATRGASFVSSDSAILPPLDADLFTQAQRLPAGESTSLVQGLLHYVVTIFGNNFRLSMESYLTQLEQLSSVYDNYKRRGRPPGNPYPEMRKNFLQVLASVLHEAIGTKPKCDYHKELLSVLDTRDTVLSFNYDCTIDYNLKLHGAGKWNATTGYGHPCYQRSASTWNPPKPAPVDETLLLLKLHGSLNWSPYPEDHPQRRLSLKQRWWRQHGDTQFEIVPPEWNKQAIRQGVYMAVWRKARERVAECGAMVLVGFSLATTDLPAQALFRVDAYRAKKLRLLVIVNPDPAVRWRIRDVLRRRLDRKTRILVFDRFKDFWSFLRHS